MRKIWKRVTAAALSLTFVLSLSACGGGGLSADDATTYVQGILDENYKGVYDPDFLELIDIVNAGKAPLEKIITNVYPFDEAAKAFEDFANNPGDMLKVVFDFSAIGK